MHHAQSKQYTSKFQPCNAYNSFHNILSRHFIAIEKERDQLITIIFANIAQSYILINGYFLVRNQAPPIFSS